jgi:hypothetical protein
LPIRVGAKLGASKRKAHASPYSCLEVGLYRRELFVCDGGVHFFVIHPGGGTEQIIWFLVLLPGSIPTAFLSDLVYKVAPSAKSVVYWMLFVGFNFGWYWAICYSIINLFLAGSGRLGSPKF